MPVETPSDTLPTGDLFGPAYLDAATFRQSVALFGVGMALCDYPDTEDGNLKLTQALQAASRMVDSFCARNFSPDDKSEQHALDLATWQFTVNNFFSVADVARLLRCARARGRAEMPALRF